jgi:spore maturation protein CgeB
LRLLLVGAGASFSTKDVEQGYLSALRGLGADVRFYSLEARLGLARDWLQSLWRARGKQPEQQPTWSDTIYRGSIEAFEMALRYDVDWVVVISGMYFHPDVLELMRRARFRTAVLLTESPYEDDKQARVARLVDLCWTTERTSVDVLRLANPNTFYIRHAYDPERHHPDMSHTDVAAHDVCFVGTGFEERIHMLDQVDWRGIDLGLYGNWTLLGSRHRLRQYVHAGPIGNDMATELYRCARIGLNLYRTSETYGRKVRHVTSAESMNPRAYELAACGVFQLSDPRLELWEVLGDAVPTFDSDTLEDVIRVHLWDSPRRRRAIHMARERIATHTFAARAAQLLVDLGAERPLAKGA